MHNQGVWPREEMGPFIIKWVENMYERKTGLRREVQYATWFEGDDFFTWDFGYDNPVLDTHMTFSEFRNRLNR